MNRRAAFEVVDKFEQALCEYTGAPYAVAVDSCTNAIFLALKWYAEHEKREAYRLINVPDHTYVGVLQAVRNAGLVPTFFPKRWAGSYAMQPSPVVDSAKRFERDMYEPKTLTCVSFQASKLLPIGRGGAILHDDPRADEWLRRARFDGRTEGADYKNPEFHSPGYHMYMTPPDAARGLWLLTYLDDNDSGTWEEYPDLSEASWR